MYAVLQRDDGTLINVRDFEHRVSSDSRTLYFDGAIDGLIRSDYTVEHSVDAHAVISELPNCLPRISGQYAGVSIKDGALEFASTDIGAKQELYYATADSELIISTDFFDLAKAIGQLEYDPMELPYFVAGGYCRHGKTTFKTIYQLPPGEALRHSPKGSLVTESYLDDFRGIKVTFGVFKNAILQAIRAVVQQSPAFEEVVMLSGGVDSSVLCALIKKVKDVSAVTYRFVPAISWNRSDEIKSERMAKKIQVRHEIVDVDLNEINLDYLDDVIISMPFAAHLSVNFKKLFSFESSVNQRRLWCGQDADSLYNYAETAPLAILSRFMFSETYARMLRGVNGYGKYGPTKRALDLFLTCLYRVRYKRRFETPTSFDALLLGVARSRDNYPPALRLLGEQAEAQNSRVEAREPIAVAEIRKQLVDEMLKTNLSDGTHYVQLQARKLFHLDNILLYSTPSIVQLFRELRLSLLDVAFSKRLLYRYARELGLSNNDFRSVEYSTKPEQTPQDSLKVFESTNFGAALRERASKLAHQMGFKWTPSPASTWDEAVRLVWLNNVWMKLTESGVELKWPTFGRR
jgi:asparagine synthetase B (glutamine-hydrolysing)